MKKSTAVCFGIIALMASLAALKGCDDSQTTLEDLQDLEEPAEPTPTLEYLEQEYETAKAALIEAAPEEWRAFETAEAELNRVASAWFAEYEAALDARESAYETAMSAATKLWEVAPDEMQAWADAWIDGREEAWEAVRRVAPDLAAKFDRATDAQLDAGRILSAAEEALEAEAPDEWTAYKVALSALEYAARDEWEAYEAARRALRQAQ